MPKRRFAELAPPFSPILHFLQLTSSSEYPILQLRVAITRNDSLHVCLIWIRNTIHFLIICHDTSQKQLAFSLDAIEFTHFEIEDHQTQITKSQTNGQNDRLQHHVVLSSQQDSQYKLNAIAQRLPHLEIRHCGIALAIQSVERLENCRRLRLPHRITQCEEKDRGDNRRPVRAHMMIAIADEDGERDHLGDVGDETGASATDARRREYSAEIRNYARRGVRMEQSALDPQKMAVMKRIHALPKKGSLILRGISPMTKAMLG